MRKNTSHSHPCPNCAELFTPPKHQAIFHPPSILCTWFSFCPECFAFLIYLANTNWFFRSQLGSHSLWKIFPEHATAVWVKSCREHPVFLIAHISHCYNGLLNCLWMVWGQSLGLVHGCISGTQHRARRLCGSINVNWMNQQISSRQGVGKPPKFQRPGTQPWAFTAEVQAFLEGKNLVSCRHCQGLCHDETNWQPMRRVE